MKKVQTKFIEKIKPHFLFNSFVFENNVFKGNVEKYCRAGQVTDDNIVHSHCMQDTKDYRHILRICTHVILTALPLQQLLHELSSLLRYTYFTCFVNFLRITRTINHPWFGRSRHIIMIVMIIIFIINFTVTITIVDIWRLVIVFLSRYL